MSDGDSDSSYTCKALKKKLSSPTFLINRSGIPVNKETWERLWSFYCGKQTKLRLECEEKARSGVKERYPSLPWFSCYKSKVSHSAVSSYMIQIRDYFKALQYNHIGTQLFDISKASGFSRLMDKAKFMMRCSLPIKCLEAVIIAMYLTCFIPKLIRFPITFKSVSNGQAFYHIVLGVQFDGQFGTIGFSRRTDLMDKPITYSNLSTLIKDFKTCYENYNHKLVKVKIGGPIPTDLCSQANIQWCRQKFTINSRTDWALLNRLPRVFKDNYTPSAYPPNQETIMSMIQMNSSLSISSPTSIRSKSKLSTRSSREQLSKNKTKRVLQRPQLVTTSRLKLKPNTMSNRRKA